VSGLAPPLFIEVPVPSQESEQFNPYTPGLVQALQSKVEGLNCSLSWLGTGTSIKSGGDKPLTFLG
jgi:hypothetical protein